MSHRKIMEDYYCDINNLSDVLGKLTNSYRLLIGGAGELNTVALAHKKDVKAAIDRVNKLGNTIDEIINTLNKSSGCYTNYCRIRSELIKGKIKMEYMENEIDEELYLNEIDEDLNEDDDKKDR
ncbi:hypothetical protein KM800_03335 [Clostridium tyrobutyricum]|uniref:hypothetical protein n=1 Tax=Clostridium tyrobutyricum TaxID=1519 RepID=UPI001C382049|nr:hypothetical protein [Clostridium tyrobutyricum]MBV4418365.1 hypothetical protein [Clostridium tyrobutyricum]